MSKNTPETLELIRTVSLGSLRFRGGVAGEDYREVSIDEIFATPKMNAIAKTGIEIVFGNNCRDEVSVTIYQGRVRIHNTFSESAATPETLQQVISTTAQRMVEKLISDEEKLQRLRDAYTPTLVLVGGSIATTRQSLTGNHSECWECGAPISRAKCTRCGEIQ